MPAVGAYLRELRERQGVSIDEIVPGRLASCTTTWRPWRAAICLAPAPVFAKGFIRAIARPSVCRPTRRSPFMTSGRAMSANGDRRSGPTAATPPSLLPPPTPVHQAQVAAAERRGSRAGGSAHQLRAPRDHGRCAVRRHDGASSGHDEGDGTAATQVAAIPAPEPAQTPVPEPAAVEPAQAPVAASPRSRSPAGAASVSRL